MLVTTSNERQRKIIEPKYGQVSAENHNRTFIDNVFRQVQGIDIKTGTRSGNL
ncbi:hypothetical protein SAMN05421636_101435 [Pricia antarctica]|uniref:Uncharacterized protein n=1 Tax=Pricia antarctica TaxID=641691 RepID=A0A1G6WVH1_9FLAO|nr:hypothetical protein SAMN05421636_101435 [Pricia antarctica]